MIIKGLMLFIYQFNQVKSCINEYFDKILNLVISNIFDCENQRCIKIFNATTILYI